MVFELGASLAFPDPSLADEDGWLAIGGDLSTARLLLAYQNGIFPWYSEGEPICWYSPHKRCVIFPDKIIVSRSMETVIAKNIFEIRINTAFEEVIKNCSQISRANQDGTWISSDMQNAYINMFEKGFARSVETWQDGKLVGGLYGIIINNTFCGESMFSKVSNASKAALISLCRDGHFAMIDCQLSNDHLLSMGAELIERKDYMHILNAEPDSEKLDPHRLNM